MKDQKLLVGKEAMKEIEAMKHVASKLKAFLHVIFCRKKNYYMSCCFILAILFIRGPLESQEILKKGIGINYKDQNAFNKIEKLNVTWYYTWNTNKIPTYTEAEFVPMIWSNKQVENFIRNKQNAYSSICNLLLFNEPDGRNQSNMTVDEAVHSWRLLSGRAKYIGSPAAVNSLGAWFREYDRQMSTQATSHDFIAMHWYGGPSPKALLTKIDNVYAAYRKPIWITEFAVADWTASETKKNIYDKHSVESFMKAVLPELDRRSFILRYAWFGASKIKPSTETSRLFNEDGSLTDLGAIYSRHKPSGSTANNKCR